MIAELRKRTQAAKDGKSQAIKALERQLKGTEGRLARLCNAIETGTIDLDETLKKRVQGLKAAKESALIELAGARRHYYMPAARILLSNIEAFSKAIRKRLQDNRPEFAKRYLQVLVDEIVINGNEAAICGSYGHLALAVQKTKEGSLNQVPSFIDAWRARKDSNLLPPGS